MGDDFDKYFVPTWNGSSGSLRSTASGSVKFDNVSDVYDYLLLGDLRLALLLQTALEGWKQQFIGNRELCIEGRTQQHVGYHCRVSLNELDADGDMKPPEAVNIASTRGELCRIRIGQSDRRMRDDDTNGGRTKIDLGWNRTHSHTVVADPLLN